MSSWDFNSWDYKTSYTYKSAKQAKKILKDAFYNKQINNKYQQPFKQNNRKPPVANPNDQQCEPNKPPVVTPPPQNHSKVYDYSYNYQYKYDGANNSKSANATQTKQKTQQNINNQNVAYQVNNVKPNKKQNEQVMDPNTIVKFKKSVLPYYLVSIFWIIYASSYPMYRWYDFIIAITLSIIVYKISNKLFKGQKIYIKKEVEPVTTGDSNVDKIIESGRDFSKQLHEANCGIQNQVISMKIERIEVICKKIIDFVSENPKKAPEIRKFMNYYMPTTLKLLKYYDKLEEQGINGENINSAMENIDSAMTTIVEAFERQLDSLFADEALDISTDISVLEGMLSQEGLMGSDFKKGK